MTGVSPPLVLKIGGSLQGCAREICTLLKEQAVPVLIVPGGGAFADLARECKVEGSAAHWMAIAAMEQYGWFLSSFGLPVTARLCTPARPIILLPYGPLRSLDPLPHRWEVTSDTIAAWCAHTLHIPLVLLKSVDGIHSGGRLCASVLSPLPTEDVDPCFLPFVLEHRVPAQVISGRSPDRIRAALKGNPTIGTTICF
ncbi:MAG: uridylate kinase [Methanolinea sp.]|jgi:hypothetical protein|nr:uridylate kinase [Methanolinea sp.]